MNTVCKPAIFSRPPVGAAVGRDQYLTIGEIYRGQRPGQAGPLLQKHTRKEFKGNSK
ncbi:hypothetical protein [Microbulbifer rhizosphaerae]|uniref:Uncharacterized protein n=1 Tax=Microbulbifer rhizosphaerae TaxID=1562603 RepID=A0A7W4Z958_9GAMM|nr:hypothetical protein [Microbulbifer rhizosphaerae]MBB3059875.1 hypothetical protein [Microbulbifer rhizosphaerae]